MSPISQTSHIAMDLEDFYISGDPIGSYPLFDAVQAVQGDDFSSITSLLASPFLSLKDLASALVEAAHYEDSTILLMLVNCRKIDEVDPQSVANALVSANSEDSISALLTIKSVEDLPVDALYQPFIRSYQWRFLKPFVSILQLENVKQAKISQLDLTSIFNRIVKSGKKEYMTALLDSPISRDLPIDDGYIIALKSRNGSVAKIIREAAGGNLKIKNVGEAFYLITKNNDHEAYLHLISNYLIPAAYMPASIRAASKVGSIVIARDMLNYMQPEFLSPADKAVLVQSFWATVFSSQNDFMNLFLNSPLIQKLIDSEDIVNHRAVVIDRYNQSTLARQQLVEEEYNSGGIEVKSRITITELRIVPFPMSGYGYNSGH